MAQTEAGTWTPDFPIGSWVEFSYANQTYANQTETAIGLITNFDLDDGEYYVVGPGQDRQDQAFLVDEWIPHHAVTKVVPSPLDSEKPKYIFMVIRPKRQISAYANLDALLAGMAGDGERYQAVREAAALAIADPDTDIKIPPGASNSPWLRFTQVEGT